MSRILFATAIMLTAALLMMILSTGCVNDNPDCSARKQVEGVYQITKDNFRAKLVTPDAEKNCHAEMFMAYSYNEPALRNPANQPAVMYEFGKIDGLFISPKPQFTDDSKENKPDYYWVTVVDQGAKTSKNDPERFHISAAVDPKNIPDDGIWISLRIRYTPVTY